MKRLFKVEDKVFSNKTEAKQYRDELGGVDMGIHVNLGPDHPRLLAQINNVKTHWGTRATAPLIQLATGSGAGK